MVFEPAALLLLLAHTPAGLTPKGKKRGIGIHAWINPYKITRGTEAKPNWDTSVLAETPIILACWENQYYIRWQSIPRAVLPVLQPRPAAHLTKCTDSSALAVTNPARLYPDLVVAHSSGELYLNPGEPMSRYLVQSHCL